MSSSTSKGSVIGGLIGLFVLAVVGVVAAIAIFNWDSTDVDEVGLVYSAGPLEGRHFQNMVAPGSSLKFLGILDYMVKLPANQRTYIVSEDVDEGDVGGELITATDSQGVELKFATSSTFELDTNANQLNRFYLDICTKYSDCEDTDEPSDGWALMLNDYYRKAQESAIRQVTREYTVDQLMKGDMTEFQSQVADATQAKLEQNMGGKFFTDITFQIQRPIAPQSVQDRYNEAKAAELQTQVKAEEVKQAEQQNLAAEKLAETLNNNPNYVELLRIEMLEEGMKNGDVQVVVVPSEGTGTNLNIN